MSGPREPHITLQWKTHSWDSNKRKMVPYRWGAHVEIMVWHGILGSTMALGFLGLTKKASLELAKKWSRRWGKMPIVWWDHCHTEVWPNPGRELEFEKCS